jgi:hypothetical protein
MNKPPDFTGDQLYVFPEYFVKQDLIMSLDDEYDGEESNTDYHKYTAMLADCVKDISQYDTDKNASMNKKARIMFCNIQRQFKIKVKEIVKLAADDDKVDLVELGKSLHQSEQARLGNAFHDVIYYLFRKAKFTVEKKKTVDGRIIDIVITEYNEKPFKEPFHMSTKNSKRDRGNDDADPGQCIFYGETKDNDLKKFCAEHKLLAVISDNGRKPKKSKKQRKKGRAHVEAAVIRLGLDLKVHDLDSLMEAIIERCCEKE